MSSSTRILTYSILFLLAVGLRLVIHYQTPLVPGINGAYYLVQARYVLENGRLGFADMPLYFYLSAGLVQLLSWFSGAQADLFYVPVIKWLDALALPMCLIPFYFLLRRLEPRALPLRYELLTTAWLVLSVSPLLLIGDFQKNGFAVALLVGCVTFAVAYLQNRKLPALLAAAVLFILTGLTHFGVLVFALLWLVVGSILWLRWRAILPILGTGIFSIALISIFDVQRTRRLFGLLSELFSHPALFHAHPPEWLIYIVSIVLLGMSYRFLFNKEQRFSKLELLLIRSSWWVILLLSFPFLHGEYARRMLLMLFIPQAILLFFIFSEARNRNKSRLAWGLTLGLLLSIAGMFGSKQPSISTAAYQELRELKSAIQQPDSTIVIARHGLEWWINWEWQVKVGNYKALQPELHQKYLQVYIIEEQPNEHFRHPPWPGPKKKDPLPSKEQLDEIIETKHFKLYEWQQTPVY